jgi:hypothetical protein
MAYQNTGYARNTTLTVTKGDYSQSYDITEAFADPADGTAYDALQPDGFKRLPEAEYQARLAAFCRRVYAEEEGLEADCPDLTRGSVEWNPTMCPVPIVAEADGPADE